MELVYQLDADTRMQKQQLTGVDGTRVSAAAPDQFQLQIFNQSDNPNTASPLYVVNLAAIARGNIRIN